MGAGGGTVIIGANNRSSVEGAHVVNNRLLVSSTGGGGGGGGDVNIIEVGGTPVGGSSVPINDAGGSITIDGTVAISNFPASQVVSGTVAVSNFPAVYPVTDNGGSLTVDGTVDVGNFPASQAVNDDGGSLTVDGTVTIVDGGGSITIDGTVTDNTQVTEDAVVPATPNLLPIAAERNDTPATLAEADGDWGHLRMDSKGALWVRPMSLILSPSGLTDGQALGITATTSGTAQTVHTAGSGIDQVHLVASNISNVGHTLTLIWGVNEKDYYIPSNDTRVVTVGEVIGNAKVIKAYATIGSAQITLSGYVERQS